jgi:hypothetical protein
VERLACLFTLFLAVCNKGVRFVPNSEQDSARGIIRAMARGWESKSVEAQQAEAAEASAPPKPRLSAGQAAEVRAKEGLLLSRRRILNELQGIQNQRHRQMLQRALAELDEKISTFR